MTQHYIIGDAAMAQYKIMYLLHLSHITTIDLSLPPTYTCPLYIYLVFKMPRVAL